MSKERQPWKLNSFLDSLILELDRAQDTLAVKGINRRLTYTVKDLMLELQLFPDFDGRDLRFTTAKPGESGAAKIAFQLGSITDRQIRETTREPVTRDDVAIEFVEGIDPETKTTLQKIGITSAKDLERMRDKNIDLAKVSDRKVDYSQLANLINRVRRRQQAPSVRAASLSVEEDGPVLAIEGENLAVAASAGDFPLAVLNGEPLRVLAASPRELRFAVDQTHVRGGPNELRIALDPYAIMTMELHS